MKLKGIPCNICTIDDKWIEPLTALMVANRVILTATAGGIYFHRSFKFFESLIILLLF